MGGKILISVDRRRHQRDSAFTLIEMMIVIVVIAILLGVLLPQFRGTQDEAAIQRARSELRTLATALESYYIHNSNAFPAALSSLTTASPRIVSSIPDDPFRAATDYTYFVSTNSHYYVVLSYGPNRAAEITAISTTGALTGTVTDDVCITNGTPAGTSSC
ncbi:MAG: prepilin-type N-terminal cleavage/methylation domain-containing protein [Candidatus Omnitrophica bacterium]|nr:prepilin-type N-terminal cleavage/methylation domain-containing protein [Candidatus Omnitrophota bacterium]